MATNFDYEFNFPSGSFDQAAYDAWLQGRAVIPMLECADLSSSSAGHANWYGDVVFFPFISSSSLALTGKGNCNCNCMLLTVHMEVISFWPHQTSLTSMQQIRLMRRRHVTPLVSIGRSCCIAFSCYIDACCI